MKETTENVSLYLDAAIQELPPLPLILAGILKLTSEDDVSVPEVERLIGSDQALTAKVLRVANSAYYGLERHVETVTQASVVLGLRQIRNLALSLSIMGVLKPHTLVQKKLHSRFWMHALGTAIAAQIIGQKKNLTKAETECLYTAGLLHDIGRLFLFTNLTDIYEGIERRSAATGQRICDVEMEVLGFNHTHVGAELAQRWHFPDFLVAIVTEHEGPFNKHSNPMNLIVNLGDAFSRKLFDGADFEKCADPVALKWVGLGKDEWKRLEDEVTVRVSSFQQHVFAEAA